MKRLKSRVNDKNLFEMRTIGSKFLIAFVISLIFFNAISINMSFYFLVLIILWVTVWINNKMSGNIKLYDALVVVSMGNLSSIIALQVIGNFEITTMDFALGSICCLVILIVWLRSCNLDSKKDQQSKPVELLKKRRQDLNRLIRYLGIFEIIALNGRWGTGKTLLVSELKNNPEIKDKYEVIEIDVLACDLNELLLILVKEIDNLLYRNRIISRYSNKLKEFFGSNTVLRQLQSLIIDNNQSYSESIKGLQKELLSLEKDVLIIYEDIDRINDVDTIKKLFSINEKLSNERIKIIYQFHEENLKNMGFSDAYLEKYLPFKVNVTESDFFETIRFILNDKNVDKNLLKIDDFYFLKKEFQQNKSTVLSENFNMGIEVYSEFRSLPFRKVKNFFAELMDTLNHNNFNEYKETVIAFYLIKHFIPSIYEELNIEEGLLENIKFVVAGRFYSLSKLIELKKLDKLWTYQLEKIFDVEENRTKCGVLSIFCYENIEVQAGIAPEKQGQGVLEESPRMIKQKNSNEKKDRIIWHLLAAGKSEYTDYENSGKKLVENVLKKPEEKRIMAFKEFEKELYSLEENEVDNRSINYFFCPFFLELFKACRTILDGEHYVKELVDLYFDIEEIKSINKEVIRTLNYSLLPDTDAYVHILKKFNQLEIIGNLNGYECFVTFINKYLCEALSNLGFINIHRHFIFDSGIIREMKEYFIKDLNKIKDEINKLQSDMHNFTSSTEIEADISTINKFVEKLIAIIKFPNEISVLKNPFKIEAKMESRLVNQEEYDRLRILLKNENDKARKEIIKSYRSGRITPYEINKLRIAENE
ncbi:hypothetical protein [uncultured Acetobacterium sp.]|uniref:hypothetical protein n=1 Tax=uncultured Acetobacterium sp. TaxID=217139 RepID=UPI0025E769AB|nr:hypothetical protein [uncultured Acetobacterium sp.]